MQNSLYLGGKIEPIYATEEKFCLENSSFLWGHIKNAFRGTYTQTLGSKFLGIN